ncbi:hypothetical protein EVAR_93364_1 [Eumeta japonica]|uniref:Uncharacterized protein n=1 Tax=Eumeta variegata TaxID=151549 RepID=A0A4C1UU64_EUMVA|nr:hypothetical protein EVAR_93364_1 [Eumeta japonica]
MQVRCGLQTPTTVVVVVEVAASATYGLTCSTVRKSERFTLIPIGKSSISNGTRYRRIRKQRADRSTIAEASTYVHIIVNGCQSSKLNRNDPSPVPLLRSDTKPTARYRRFRLVPGRRVVIRHTHSAYIKAYVKIITETVGSKSRMREISSVHLLVYSWLQVAVAVIRMAAYYNKTIKGLADSIAETHPRPAGGRRDSTAAGAGAGPVDRRGRPPLVRASADRGGLSHGPIRP